MELVHAMTTRWRAHLVGLRRGWHPHQGVSVLGDRGGWLIVRPSVQAAALSRAAALVGAVLNRGGRLWMFGGSPHPGRTPTPWGTLWGEWLPGQLTNSLFYRARRGLVPVRPGRAHPGWARPGRSQARSPLVRHLGWALHAWGFGGWGVTWARSGPTRVGSTRRARRWIHRRARILVRARRWKVQIQMAVRRRQQVRRRARPPQVVKASRFQTSPDGLPTVVGAVAPIGGVGGLVGEANSIGAPIVLFYGAHLTPWSTPWGVPWGGAERPGWGAARVWGGVHRRGWAARTVRTLWGRVSGAPHLTLTPPDSKSGGGEPTGESHP